MSGKVTTVSEINLLFRRVFLFAKFEGNKLRYSAPRRYRKYVSRGKSMNRRLLNGPERIFVENDKQLQSADPRYR